MSGFKTDNNSGDIYYDDVEYTLRKVKKAKISTSAGTQGIVDINLSYQNTPGSNDAYTVDSKISLVPGEGMSFAQDSNTGTITLTGTPKNKLNATTDPTKDDDSSEGYTVGSFWVNIFVDVNGTRHNKAFLCTSALDGNAVWTTIDKMTVKSAAPTANNDGGSPDGTNADRGYAIGSFWLDITTQTDPKLYVCVSNAVNGASWKEVGASSGPQVLLKTANPLPADPEYNSASVGTIWITMGPDLSIKHSIFMKLKTWNDGGLPVSYWAALNTYTTYDGDPSNNAFSSSFPAGSMWYNGTDRTLWIAQSGYQNTAWERISPYRLGSSPTTSNKLPEGTIWVNTTDDTAWISVDKTVGTWLQLGSGGGLAPIVSANAPTTVNKEPEGTLWIKSDTDNAWISVDQAAGTWQLIGKTIVSTSAPTTLNKESEGTLWVESNTDKAWISVDQAAGTWKLIADGLPAGNHTEVQFNKNNEFGASSNLVYTDWEEKGGALKQKYDNTSNAYNYYNYRTALTSGGRAHFHSYHMPSSIYTSTGILNAYHGIHLVDASSTSPIILTLPGAGITESAITGTTGLPSVVPFGYIIKIKRIDIGSSSLSNIVLIRAPSGYLIDGFDGIDLPLQQRESVTLYLSADHPTAGIKNWLIL